MRTLSLAFVSASFLAAVPAFATPSNWEIDPAHSAATFSIKHLGVSTVRGEFGRLTGTATLDPTDPKGGKVQATIDASSVSTREPKRDEHLKSPDFFDVAKYPTLSFKSTSVTPSAGGGWKLNGDLTIHGVTKQVSFDVQPLSAETKTPFGTTIVGTSATGKINRNDFGVTGGKAGMLLGNDVTITLDIELVKKAAK